MGVTPVTVAQFRAFTRATGRPAPRDPGFRQRPDHPSVNVAWDDAVAFCDWLSKRLGQSVRLPTEAEWEVACRARTSTPFATGPVLDTRQANFDGSHAYGPAARQGLASRGTFPVGLWANGWGLADMHGQVWEWCLDTYTTDPSGGRVDPLVESIRSARVVRGGSWKEPAWRCRSASRDQRPTVLIAEDVGFRIVVVDQ